MRAYLCAALLAASGGLAAASLAGAEAEASRDALREAREARAGELGEN